MSTLPHTDPLSARHNVNVFGDGLFTLLFVHGFGCNQTMWRKLAEAFSGQARVVLWDLMGHGLSDAASYDEARYDGLQGHAADLLQVLERSVPPDSPVVLVGHSVGAMIGMLADLPSAPQVCAHVMVAPSPCYFNDGAYRGGFEAADIDELLRFLALNRTEWSRMLARLAVGGPATGALLLELTESFCASDDRAARQLAHATFLSDHRATLERLHKPALILQCSQDVIAPPEVGRFMQEQLPQGRLEVIDNVGHCPHLTAPEACIAAMQAFMATLEPPRPSGAAPR